MSIDISLGSCCYFYLTLPGVGEGEGVRVDVVLPFDEVFLLRDDLIGVTEELPLVPLVELFGEVVLDIVLKADGTLDLLKTTFIIRINFINSLHVFLSSAEYIQNQLFPHKKILKEYHQSVKQFGPRSGWTFCRA